jgi:hypothetical protein
MTTAKISVSTREYEASHSRKPRGTGVWYFTLTVDGATIEVVRSYGTYTEALKVAMARARELGADTICVGA